MTILDTCPEISDHMAIKLLSMLERDGCFNDENSLIGSVAIEHHYEFIEKRLRDVGYKGPVLEQGAHFYSMYGAVYWLYDSSRVSRAEARHQADCWVQSHNR